MAARIPRFHQLVKSLVGILETGYKVSRKHENVHLKGGAFQFLDRNTRNSLHNIHRTLKSATEIARMKHAHTVAAFNDAFKAFRA